MWSVFHLSSCALSEDPHSTGQSFWASVFTEIFLDPAMEFDSQETLNRIFQECEMANRYKRTHFAFIFNGLCMLVYFFHNLNIVSVHIHLLEPCKSTFGGQERIITIFFLRKLKMKEEVYAVNTASKYQKKGKLRREFGPVTFLAFPVHGDN